MPSPSQPLPSPPPEQEGIQGEENVPQPTQDRGTGHNTSHLDGVQLKNSDNFRQHFCW